MPFIGYLLESGWLKLELILKSFRKCILYVRKDILENPTVKTVCIKARIPKGVEGWGEHTLDSTQGYSITEKEKDYCYRKLLYGFSL